MKGKELLVDSIFLAEEKGSSASTIVIKESTIEEAFEFIENNNLNNSYRLLAVCPKRETSALVKFFRIQNWGRNIEKIIKHEKKNSKKN